MSDHGKPTPEEFTDQCYALGCKLTDALFGAPKAVAICTFPGVMAAVAKTFGIPRDVVIQMFDSAMEDINAVTKISAAFR